MKKSPIEYYPLPVKVKDAPFKAFNTVALLDHAALSKGVHVIEVGVFETACCEVIVQAKLSKGKVVGFDLRTCPDCQAPKQKELQRFLAAMAKKHGIQTEFPTLAISELTPQRLGSLMARRFTCIDFGDLFYCCVYWLGGFCRTGPIIRDGRL